MNTEYLLWFGALVAVAGGALLWLAIGEVPEIPAEPEADDADPDDADPTTSEPDPAAEEPGSPPSELAGEDGVAESA